MSQDRTQRILDALKTEFERQGNATGPDLLALAKAVDRALGPDEALAPLPVDEGVTPERLTAENDG